MRRERRRRPAVTAGERIRGLAVLREIETRVLVVLVDAEAAGDGAGDSEADERSGDRHRVGGEHGADLRAEETEPTAEEESLTLGPLRDHRRVHRTRCPEAGRDGAPRAADAVHADDVE